MLLLLSGSHRPLLQIWTKARNFRTLRFFISQEVTDFTRTDTISHIWIAEVILGIFLTLMQPIGSDRSCTLTTTRMAYVSFGLSLSGTKLTTISCCERIADCTSFLSLSCNFLCKLILSQQILGYKAQRIPHHLRNITRLLVETWESDERSL